MFVEHHLTSNMQWTAFVVVSSSQDTMNYETYGRNRREVSNHVIVEPRLTPLAGEQLVHKSAIKTDGSRTVQYLDISSHLESCSRKIDALYWRDWRSIFRFSRGIEFSSNTGAYRIVGSLPNPIDTGLISNNRACIRKYRRASISLKTNQDIYRRSY